VVIALWADLEVLFDDLPVNDLAARITFLPERIGELLFLPSFSVFFLPLLKKAIF
jgi:hypothetical protein